MLVAAAVIVSVVVLTMSLQRVSSEMALLRHSMRRARAAGVANDDLAHLTGALAARMHQLESAVTIRRLRSRRGYDAR